MIHAARAKNMSSTKTDIINAHDGAGGFVRPLTVTIATARQITGLGNTTLWKLIGEKKLKTVRIGRRRLVVYESLHALLAPSSDTQPQSPHRGRPRKQRSVLSARDASSTR
jgi:excisionase family DNA binding protein